MRQHVRCLRILSQKINLVLGQICVWVTAKNDKENTPVNNCLDKEAGLRKLKTQQLRVDVLKVLLFHYKSSLLINFNVVYEKTFVLENLVQKTVCQNGDAQDKKNVKTLISRKQYEKQNKNYLICVVLVLRVNDKLCK